MKTSTRALEHFLNEIKDDSLGRMIVFLKAISQTQTSVVLTHGPQKKKSHEMRFHRRDFPPGTRNLWRNFHCRDKGLNELPKTLFYPPQKVSAQGVEFFKSTGTLGMGLEALDTSD